MLKSIALDPDTFGYIMDKDGLIEAVLGNITVQNQLGFAFLSSDYNFNRLTSVYDTNQSKIIDTANIIFSKVPDLTTIETDITFTYTDSGNVYQVYAIVRRFIGNIF